MGKLTIAHISDAHWSGASAASQELITKRLIEDLGILRSRGIKPDLIIFSGDLVQAGDNSDSFKKAMHAILVPLAKACTLTIDRVFVVPGNHDISRNIVRDQSVLEIGLKSQIKSFDDLSKFFQRYNSDSESEVLSLKRVNNFYQWHDEFFKHTSKLGPFGRVSIGRIAGKKIGLALLNTAWRATGESGGVDDGNLLIGTEVVDAALSEIENCDYKIAVLHHPIEYLAEFERDSARNRISKNFNLVCTGHTHYPRPERIEDVYGASIHSKSGSFYAGSKWFNGYQVIEVDFVKDTTSIYCREYFPHQEKFDKSANLLNADPVVFDFSVKNQSLDDQIGLFLDVNQEILKSRFLEHLNFVKSDLFKGNSLIEGYACPKLFIQNESQIDESGNLTESYKKITVDDLLESSDNLVFHGVRQSGKTALKLYMAYRYGFGIGVTPKIPVFIDAKKFQWNLYGIRRAMQMLYDIPSKFHLEESIKAGNVVFFFEDIGRLDSGDLEKLKSFSDNYHPCRTISFGCPDEHSISKERHFRKVLTGSIVVGLGEITRNTIRRMAQSWFDDTQEAKAKFDLVVGQINRDGLPRTAYMVGLLLWAAKQGQRGDRLNEALLLQNVLDHLLDRANFKSTKRGELTTRGKELLLNEIANRFDSNGNEARSAEVISWVDEYFQRKKRGHDPAQVVDELVNCGILSRYEGYISFRYRCFQEYYIAQGMMDSSERDDKSAGIKFLKRGREIELLSGLQADNAPIIENIMEVLLARVPRDLADISLDDFDQVAYGSTSLFVTRDKIRKIRRTRLSEEQLDQVMDALDERATARGEKPLSESLEESGGNMVEAASRRQAEAVRRDIDDDSDFLRPSSFMAGLSILARVLRNSDYTDYDVKGPALDRLLEFWCRIHVILYKEVRWILNQMEELVEDKLDEEEFDTLVGIVSKMLFGTIASNLTNDLSTPALTDSLAELDDGHHLATGKRLLALSLLEDADDPSWPERWKSVIESPDTPAFDIDILVDRLWRCVNRKALDEDQDRRVVKVVDAIEARFDWGNEKKSSVLENIREMATIKKLAKD